MAETGATVLENTVIVLVTEQNVTGSVSVTVIVPAVV